MRYFILLFVIYFFTNLALANEIAITFDDLPAQETDEASGQIEINDKILKALNKHQATATGFVNEKKLYKNDESKEKVGILQLWIEHGNQLGNHTYSHPALSRSKLSDYKIEVIKGEKVTKQLMSHAGLRLTYFRHPYLDTGTSDTIRKPFEKFLKDKGYRVAPVTIDTDDWKFNQELLKNPKLKEQIVSKYIEHTKKKFAFYDSASKKIFGRNISHVWLLHANLINATAMDKLLTMLKELDYKVVSLERALTDKAYAEPDNYYAPFGVSWLYRWDFTRGKVFDWSQDPEPDNNPFISKKATES